MKKSKLLFSFIIFLACVFTLVACKKTQKPTNTTATPQTSVTTDKPVTTTKGPSVTTKAPGTTAAPQTTAAPATQAPGTTAPVVTTTKKTLPEGTLELDSIPEGKFSLQSVADEKTANASMSFGYKDTVLEFTAYVTDEVVYTSGNVFTNDSIELALDKEVRQTGYTDNTVSIIVDAKGNLSVKALSTRDDIDDSGVTSEAKLFSLDHETIAGYMIKISVPYTLIGVSKDSHNAAVCIALTNANAQNKVKVEVRTTEGEEYENVNTFARITEDGSLEANKYAQLGCVWGNAETLTMVESWNILNDDDTENAYIEMTSSINDNNIYMHKSNALEEYVEVKLTTKELLNGEKWGKFGINLRSKDGNRGFFFYVDAASADGTTFNENSVSLGYNIYNGEGAWAGNWSNIGSLGGNSTQYQNDNYVTLGVYRKGSVFSLYANGTLVKYVSCDIDEREEAYFGLVSFNILLKAKEYKVQKDNLTPYQFEADEVDYLFLGDSYIDTAFWYNYDSAFGTLDSANIGVGGTKVDYWINQLAAVSALYAPKNIIIHIGVNDIDDGNTTGEYAYGRLEVMLNKYHAKFPEATIYFANICHNMMFTAKWGEYDAFNALVNTFAQNNSWVKVIDMASLITKENNSTMRWYNADGLHYGVDGYALFNKAVKDALGLTFAFEGNAGDVNVEGAPTLVHTPTWAVEEENGQVVYHNTGRSFDRIGSEAQFFFTGLYSNNFYAEAKISLEECYCATDEWAKTGIAIRTASGTYFFFMNSSTVTNPDRIDGHVHYTDNWGSVMYRPEVSNRNWDALDNVYVPLGTPGYDHKFDHSYMTLGVARIGSRLAFWANGQLVKLIDVSTLGADEMAAVSIFSFNMNAYVKDLTYTTDLAEVRAKMPYHTVNVPEATPALQVTTSKTSTFEGDTVELTVTVKDGITVDEVRINGGILEKTDGKYTFTMPYANVDVTVKISGSVLVVDSAIKDGITLSNNDPAEGEEVTITAKEGWIVKSLLLNGTALTAEAGTYKFTLNSYMELTGEVILPADQINIDLELETALYGTPDHFWVDGNRDVTVYAAKGKNGVYMYVIAHTNTSVTGQANWWESHNFEFKINQGAQMYINSDGVTNIGAHQVSVKQLTDGDFSGKYEHRYEFFIPKDSITNWNLEGELEFGYAYKAIGEATQHENQSWYNWTDNYWQTTVSAINKRIMEFNQPEAHPGNCFITKTGLRLVSPSVAPTNGTVDGNLTEFASKASVLLGDDKSKFLICAYTANDGLYIGVKVYSKNISHDVPEWWLNDNLEFTYNGTLFGLVIYDKFVSYSCGNASAAAVRSELTSGDMYDAGYRYETDIEYFIPGLTQAGNFQISSNGNGFREAAWIALIWNSDFVHVDENGVRYERSVTAPETTSICTPTLNKTTAYVGDTIELTLALADGVTVNQVKANDQVLTLVDGKYSFTMPDQNVVITVTFNTLLDFSAISQFATVSNENPSYGDTITISPKGQYIIKSLLNGETPLTITAGVVELTITGKTVLTGEFILPADNINIDLAFENSLYGDPVHFWVQDNRDVTVYAAKGALGVYVYVITHTNANVTTAENWYDNHNFEFELNGGEHFHIANNDDVYGITEFRRTSTLLESGDFTGKYEHKYEFFVPAANITGWNLTDEVEFGYAYKAIGEPARFEGQSFNQWPVDNFWQTTTGALNTRFMKMYEGEMHPNNLFVGTNGLDDKSRAAAVKHATIDADLTEYASKSSITVGNTNAKFVITGFSADDGLYLAVKVYQVIIAAPTDEWWLNDNLQISYGCDYQNLGFSIFDHFVTATWETKSAMNRVELTSGEMYDAGYRYETTVELFCPGLGAGTIQFGCNGNGFANGTENGWQAMVWDSNLAYVAADGVHQDVYADRASILTAEGITVDGLFNEEIWTDAVKAKVWTNVVKGSRVSFIGRRLQDTNTIVLGVTVEHNHQITEFVQGDGSAWWNYIGPEFRLNWNPDRQYASSPYLNTTISSATTAVSACNTVANGEGADYAYTTTYEFVVVYSGYKLDYCPVCLGGVWDEGFDWVWGFSWVLKVENDGLYLTA